MICIVDRLAKVELDELSIEKDHERIAHLLAGYEFPWDFIRSLEVALLRSYSALSVSRLLDATGEFRERGQQRYDDTALLVAEFLKNGYDSPRGSAAIKRLNVQHLNREGAMTIVPRRRGPATELGSHVVHIQLEQFFRVRFGKLIRITSHADF